MTDILRSDESFKPVKPESAGLQKRDNIIEISTDHLAFVIHRKSRIIMKDGRRILEKVMKIKSIHPEYQVSLMTDAPVCSKAQSFLESHAIEIISIQK